MTAEELKGIVRKGESETLDFKESFDREGVETAGAFSNSNGGKIVIGVSDNGLIKGTQIGKETINDWINQISQSSNPRIIPDIEELTINDKNIVVITIMQCPIKPVAVKGKCFRRVKNSNRLMTPQEIADMHYKSIEMSWDLTPAFSYKLNDIDENMVRKYIDRANATGRRKISKEEPVLDVLKKLKLVREGVPTWAALLLFGKESYISQAQIHCGRFKNEMLVIDDRKIDGSIIDQIDGAMEFIKKNISVKFIMTGRPARENVWDYPLEAIREALVNAVCHRNYTVSSHISIRIFDDRLEMWNPGTLPSGVSVEDLYKTHDSDARNKGVAEMFFDIAFIEQWGSGIGKMINLCREAGIPEPKIKERQRGFQITFSKDVYSEEYLQNLGLNERQLKSIVYIKEKGRITNKEYQKLCGISERTATRDLGNLVKLKIFEQFGVTGKGTEYILRRHIDAKDATKTPQRRHNDATNHSLNHKLNNSGLAQTTEKAQ